MSVANPSDAVPVEVQTPARERIYRHAAATRVTHWINFLCVAVLLFSGLQIFNAHPRLYWGQYGANLDRRFTFDSFIVGGSNRLAHAAANQVAETALSEPVRFNPLYIHSAVGLGKSHLLQAIAWEVKSRQPHAQIDIEPDALPASMLMLVNADVAVQHQVAHEHPRQPVIRRGRGRGRAFGRAAGKLAGQDALQGHRSLHGGSDNYARGRKPGQTAACGTR